MKKLLKRVLALSLCACMVLGMTISTQAVGNDIEQVFPKEISDGVLVYKHISTNEMFADFSLDNFEVGDEIILYRDSITNATVSIVVNDFQPAASTYASGDSGWGSGFAPTGTYTLTPNYQEGLIYIGFTLDVSTYPVNFDLIYNPNISNPFNQVSDISYSIIRASATSNQPAIASMTFVDSVITDIIGSATSGYLTFQMNENGNTRVQWKY